MTFSTEALTVIMGLGGVISTLAGVIYKQQQARLADQAARITTLETEARDTLKAKDMEKDQWRQMALARLNETPKP